MPVSAWQVVGTIIRIIGVVVGVGVPIAMAVVVLRRFRQRRRVATLQAADHVEDGGADENASPTGAANVAESTAAAVLTADVIKGIHAPAPASEVVRRL
jgi:hypothetical protein